MAITIGQAINFCEMFRTEKLSEHGTFKKEHLKGLSRADRKVCMVALKKIEQAQLKDWDSSSKVASKKMLDPERLTEITQKIQEDPKAAKSKKTPWYKVPFIGIANAVNSVYLWFQNTFFGRISSKQLLDKVAMYCQDANNAPQSIKDNNDVKIPELTKMIDQKIDQRKHILKNQLANGLLEIYKILLALKSEAKRESVISKAIFYNHVDGLDDPETNPFHRIVHDCLAPYFQGDFKKGFQLTPYYQFNTVAMELDGVNLGMKEPEGKLFEAECKYKEGLQKLNEATLAHNSALDEAVEEMKAKKDEASEELEKLHETVVKYNDELAYLQQKFDEKSQKLKMNFMTIAGSMRPLLLADKSKMVREILCELFNAANLAIQLENSFEEAYKSVKKNDTVETREVYNKLKVQLDQQIDKVNIKFDYSFKLIEDNINIQGIKLKELKFDNVKELGNVSSKLQLSKLKFYGLVSLTKYRELYINEVKLLKLKYNISG